MKLKPYGWRVYVAPIDLQEDAGMSDYLKKVGFEVKAGLDANDDRRAKVALTAGKLVSVGPMAFKTKEWGWWLFRWWYGKPPQVGDKVWFGRYAGRLVLDPSDGVEYMLLNDEDLQSQIEE